MIEIGRVCVKIAGRDAGKKCIIVDILDGNHVLIDGETRRRKCNIMHLEPLDKTADIKKGASHAEAAKAFSALGYEMRETKPKKTAPRPRKARKSKLAKETAEATPAAKKPETSNEKPAAKTAEKKSQA